jgi:hypothetical protein
MILEPKKGKIMNEYLEDDYENHVDVLIELISQFSEVADNSIYQTVFNTVVNHLKQEESPECIETVNNAWEFLGVINYHGGDHGLYEIAVADLRGIVENTIKCLPLHERFLFILANCQGYFNWQKDFKHDVFDTETLIKYMTTGEPFYEAAAYITSAIQSHAPDFAPDY